MQQAKKFRFIAVSICCILAAACGFYYFHYRHLVSTDDAYIQADLVTISSQVAGEVKQILFTENQQVAKNELLAIIEDTNYNARLEALKAEQQMQLVKIDSYRDRIVAEQSQTDQAEADYSIAKAKLARAEKEYNRISNLARKDFSSPRNYDDAKVEFEQAKFSLDKAKANLAMQQAQTNLLGAELKAENFKLAQINSNITIAGKDLANTKIYAPIPGTVTNKSLEVGSLAKPSAPVCMIIPKNNFFVVANFKETQLTNIKIAQPAYIEVDAWAGKKFTGKVQSITRATGSKFSLFPPENASGNFTKIVQRVAVRIELDPNSELQDKLAAGFSVIAIIDTRPAS